MRSGTSRFLTGVASCVSIVSLRLSAQTPPPTQAAPSTAAQPAPEPEGWAALEPGQGFQVAKTEKGDLWISADGLFRYLNQLPADQTFVDQGSYIFKPANVEVYASTSYVFGDKSDGYSTTTSGSSASPSFRSTPATSR